MSVWLEIGLNNFGEPPKLEIENEKVAEGPCFNYFDGNSDGMGAC